MEVSPGVFVTCFLTVLILTIYIYFIIYIRQDLMHDGMKFVFVVIALILVRMLIPLNFPFTITISSSVFFPPIIRGLFYHIGGKNIRPVDILCVIWIVGGCVRLCRLIYRQRGYRRYLQPFLIRDWSEHQVLKEVLEEYGMSSLQVCVLPMAVSPSMFGLRKPILILPDWEFSRSELFHICHHEIEHIKKHDLWLNWFVELVVCIQWFNPLAYLMRRALILAFELSNDLEILKNSNEKQRLEYAACIIRVSRMQDIVPNSPNVLSFVGLMKPELDTRVEFISSEIAGTIKKSSKFSKVLRTAVVVLLLVVSCVFVIEADRVDEPVKTDTVSVSEDNSYFVRVETGYEWYVNDVYMYTFNPIPEEFADLPIIEEDVK